MSPLYRSLASILTVAGILITLTTFIFHTVPATAKTRPTVTCKVKWVHDGDTFRCDGYKKSTRLYGVDAPEMPGACREGRACVAGDPYASRDYLEKLIGKRPLSCVLMDTDRYRRPVMRCSTASRKDLSCAMVKAGKAVERYGLLGC